ncbi:MAG: transposase [Candidatus Omnitrophota bacterium]
MAQNKGIVSDKLHIVDATAVQGKVDLYRIKEKYKDQDPDTYIDKHSPDPDARPGRKHKGKRFFGYKAHCLMDAESEIIVNADASRGNEHERTTLIYLSEPTSQPRALAADKGYDTGENHDYLSRRRIRNGIMLRSNHTTKYIRHHITRVSRVAKRYRCVIEHKFAELKQRHGLRTARYRGLTKMRIQLYMVAMCANMKRMVKLSYSNLPPPIIRFRSVPG